MPRPPHLQGIALASRGCAISQQDDIFTLCTSKVIGQYYHRHVLGQGLNVQHSDVLLLQIHGRVEAYLDEAVNKW